MAMAASAAMQVAKANNAANNAYSQVGTKENDDDDDEPKGDFTKKVAEIGASATTLGLNVYSYVTLGNIPALTACSVATLVSGRVAINAVNMGDKNTMRRVQNLLRETVNDLSYENEQLTKKLDELKVNVFCLKEAQQRLGGIAGGHAENAQRIVQLAEENQKIIDERKKLMRESIANDVMTFILKADNDGSGEFDKRELNFLIRNLSKKPEIIVNEGKLRKILEGEHNSVATVMELVHDISRDDIPDEERIIGVNPDYFSKFDEDNEEDKKSKKKKGKKGPGSVGSAKKKKPQKKDVEEEKVGSDDDDDDESDDDNKSTKSNKSNRSTKSNKSTRSLKSEKSGASSKRRGKKDKDPSPERFEDDDDDDGDEFGEEKSMDSLSSDDDDDDEFNKILKKHGGGMNTDDDDDSSDDSDFGSSRLSVGKKKKLSGGDMDDSMRGNLARSSGSISVSSKSKSKKKSGLFGSNRSVGSTGKKKKKKGSLMSASAHGLSFTDSPKSRGVRRKMTKGKSMSLRNLRTDDDSDDASSKKSKKSLSSRKKDDSSKSLSSRKKDDSSKSLGSTRSRRKDDSSKSLGSTRSRKKEDDSGSKSTRSRSTSRPRRARSTSRSRPTRTNSDSKPRRTARKK